MSQNDPVRPPQRSIPAGRVCPSPGTPMSHNVYYVNQLVSTGHTAAEGAGPGLPPANGNRGPAGPSSGRNHLRAFLPRSITRCVLVAAVALAVTFTAAQPVAAQTDPMIVPGPDDALVFDALAATVAGDSLSLDELEAVSALLSLSHDDLMTRARAHVEAGMPGRAEVELTLVVAGADTSPGNSYAQLSLLAYAQILQDRKQHATASLIFAAGAYDELDRPSHPVMPGEAAMQLAAAYIDIARGAPEADREPLGRQAALWWARAGADGHLLSLAARGLDERLIAAWAYAQVGRIDRATVEIARARLGYRGILHADSSDADAHEGLSRSYEASVTGVRASANADSARIHRDAAERILNCEETPAR